MTFGMHPAGPGMRKYQRLILFLVIPALAGCSSIHYRYTKNNLVSPGPYPGVRTNLEYLRPGSHGLHPELDSGYVSLAQIAFVDMPLSFVADTVCLPHDLFDNKPRLEKNEPPQPLKPPEEEPWPAEEDSEDQPAFGD